MQRLPIVLIGAILGIYAPFGIGQNGMNGESAAARAVPGPSYRKQVATSAAATELIERDRAVRPKSIYTRVVDRVHPSVVSIETRVGQTGASGTGIVVDADGAILTNYHVISDADRVEVILSSYDRYVARVAGFDRATDLALLKIDGLSGLQPATFADSDGVEVGEEVVAMGNALGLGWTVSRGIVSSLHRSAEIRRTDTKGLYKDYIQTDAAINQGDSGGPLVDLNGEVVGINVAILDANGIGFAIPANDAKFVAKSLIRSGRVTRGFLGFAGGSPHELTNEQRRRFGLATSGGFVLVREVTPNSPAFGAGLKQGDVITAVDRKSVDDYDSLRNRIARFVPGATVNLSIYRDGVFKDLPVQVGTLPTAD